MYSVAPEERDKSSAKFKEVRLHWLGRLDEKDESTTYCQIEWVIRRLLDKMIICRASSSNALTTIPQCIHTWTQINEAYDFLMKRVSSNQWDEEEDW